MPNKPSAADRDAYDQLVEQLDLRRPSWGWTSERDLPRLNDEQLAVCLRANPHLIDDFMADHTSGFWASELSDCLEGKALGGCTLGEYLTGSFMVYLTKEARRELATALIERQEDGEDPYAIEAQEADSLNDAERAL